MTERVFFAINLPREIKQDLARIVTPFAARHRERQIAWVSESNFHITLQFIGESTDLEIARLHAVGYMAAGRIKPFELVTGSFGCFPSASRPRVVMIETSNTDHATELVRTLRSELEKQGFTREAQPWHAHITLGRVKDKRGTCDLDGVTLSPHTIPVTSFELMASTLDPRGSTHRVLTSYPLERSL